MIEPSEEDDLIAALDEEAVIAGWNACRRSIYSVCEDVQSEAKRLRITSKVGTASEEQHAKGYYAGSCYAAKSIARGFGAMNAMDDDNVQSALLALRSRPASALPVVGEAALVAFNKAIEIAEEIASDSMYSVFYRKGARAVATAIRSALSPSVQP